MLQRSLQSVTHFVLTLLVGALSASAALAQEPLVTAPATAESAPASETTAVSTQPVAPAVQPDAPAPAAPATNAAPAAEAPKSLTGWDEGFFLRTEDEKFKLRLGGFVQGRFNYENDETVGSDGKKTSDDSFAFSLPRARLKIDGNVFTKRLRYELMADFGKGSAGLKDYWADYELVEKVLFIKIGQFKRPFSRQQINSSNKLEFSDVALTDKAFGAGYDIGVMLHDNYTKSPTFEWALGVFNGEGGDKPWFDKGKVTGTAAPNADDPTVTDVTGTVDKGAKFNNVPLKAHPMVVARVGFNTKDLKGYSEADLEGGPARFGAALSGIADFDADKTKDGNLRSEVDYILKVQGFDTTGGFYLASAEDGDKFSDQKYASLGFHLQAGYTIKKLVQPEVRYAYVNPKGSDNNLQELLGGLSVYFYGHNLKWQTEGGALINESSAGNLTTPIVRTQLQLGF